MHSAAPELDIEIRDATAADLPALEHVLPSAGEHARQLANAVAGRRSFLVALDAGRPVGTVVVRWTGVTVEGLGALPEIGSLAVVPAVRGRGIGTRLVAAAEQRVRERGGSAAVLLVAESNDGARRLYERLGYRDTGRRRPVTGADRPDLVLVRELAADR